MGTRGFIGQNPPVGPKIAYLVRDIAADAKVSLEIVNSAGIVVRMLPVNRNPGLYRNVWDMRVGAPLTGPIDLTDTAIVVAGAGGRGGRGGGGGGFGGRGGASTAAATFFALPGSYKVRFTITPKNGAAIVQEQSFVLLRDSIVPLTTAELKTLYTYRLDLARFQRSVRDAQAKVDTIQRALADAKRATDSAKTPLAEAPKAELAALEKEMADVTLQIGSAGRGGRGGGRGGRGGGGTGTGAGAGGDAAVPPVVVADSAPPVIPPATPSSRTIQARLGTMTDLMNVLFPPSLQQLKTLKGFPAELQQQVDRIMKVSKERLPALLKTLQAAGVDVKPSN